MARRLIVNGKMMSSDFEGKGEVGRGGGGGEEEEVHFSVLHLATQNRHITVPYGNARWGNASANQLRRPSNVQAFVMPTVWMNEEATRIANPKMGGAATSTLSLNLSQAFQLLSPHPTP